MDSKSPAEMERNPSSSPGSPPHLKLHNRSISVNHRQSFSDQLRGNPASPRAQRQPSLPHAAVQDLFDNPPAASAGDPAFAGRDWKEICVGELVNKDDVRTVDPLTGVEEATNLLIESGIHVVLIQDGGQVLSTFDFSDLNMYLLLVVGLAEPEEGNITSFRELINKARQGSKIPIKDVKDLAKKEPFVALPHSANLTKAVEIFGSGVHRIIVQDETTKEIRGILSQLRLVKFLWENGRSFPIIDQLYPQYLKGLDIASHQVFAINGDKSLAEALELMNNEGVTSLAVIDNQMNVVGNISTVDVQLLTKSSSLPLLQSSCIHFISVILSSRGIRDGKDSVPVFHVNPYSTLAHTVAKLVATKSHRMWVVDSQSPSVTAPPTPISQPAVTIPPPSLSGAPSTPITPGLPPLAPSPGSHFPSISASANPGSTMSGRLIGVVSLTDILNLFARHSGLSPIDPNETRRRRRRSSSSSVRGKVSMDSMRSSSVDTRRSGV